MDNLPKQSNKAKKKRNGRKNKKKLQPASKASTAASGGADSTCSRNSSGSIRAGGADVVARSDEMAPHHLLKQQTKQTADPTSASTVQQMTGPATSKISGLAQASAQDASTPAAVVLPFCRPLHSCPTPWRPGEKSAPVQLKNSANSSETHHRTILAILNRITDTKMELLLSRSVSLILPLHSNNNSPVARSVDQSQLNSTTFNADQSLAEPTSNSNRYSSCSGKIVNASEEKRSKLPIKSKRFEAPNRVDEIIVGTASGVTPGTQWNIQRVRKDFVSMLLEKAQEEEMYTREYSWFLRGLCAAIEVEADCAQLALERVQERWGEAVLPGRNLEREIHPGRKLEKMFPCNKTPITVKENSMQQSNDVGAGVKERTEDTVDEFRNGQRGKRKGTRVNNVGAEEDYFSSTSGARSDCHEERSQYGISQRQSCVDVMTHQSSRGIELSENVCDITVDNALDTCSSYSNNDKTFCDTSSLNEIFPTDSELDAFLRNSSSLKKESRQISCCGAYGDLSRFRTVIRHRALYRELFTQEPSFRELISTEALFRFNVLYGSLRQLYAGATPWDEDEERHLRRRLKNHLRLMVMLHLSTLLPLATLELVRNTLAGPLENPAAAAPFAGVLAFGAPNPPQGGGMMPPPPPQNAQDAVADDNQNLPIDPEAVPQQENEHLVAGVPFEQDAAPANVAQINNVNNNAANNNLIAAVAVVNDPNNANLNHAGNINNANVNNPNNVDGNNPNNGNPNNINNHHNINNINDNINNLNNNANINNLNNVNNVHTSAASLMGMSAELLSFYLTTAGHINLRDRARTDEVCDLLQQTLPHLSSRQTFLVVTVLELQQRGWTEVKAPDRSG